MDDDGLRVGRTKKARKGVDAGEALSNASKVLAFHYLWNPSINIHDQT